jgi:hypothetical protein
MALQQNILPLKEHSEDIYHEDHAYIWNTK